MVALATGLTAAIGPIPVTVVEATHPVSPDTGGPRPLTFPPATCKYSQALSMTTTPTSMTSDIYQQVVTLYRYHLTQY